MTKSVTAMFAVLLIASAYSSTEDLRNLQVYSNSTNATNGNSGTIPPRINPGKLKSYPDAVQIYWLVTLGCGACIRGNYIFCVNGKEG